MRQKKKPEDSKLEQEQEACVKCSKLQNGHHSSFEETESQTKQTTLGTLKSVLKRSASHKKEKVNKNPEKMVSKDVQIVSKKTKNRVQFDETQNKYFEADYVILIHEEDYDLDDYYDEGSPFDDEDDDSYDDSMSGPKICCSNPNCNNMISLSNYPEYGYSNSGLVDFKYSREEPKDRFEYAGHYYDVNYEELNQNQRKSSTKPTNRCENEKCENCNNYFDFEVSRLNTSQDFSDQVTLSPPEGYKDGGSQYCPHHGLQFHNCINDGSREGFQNKSLQFHDGDKRSDDEEEEVREFDEENEAEETEENAITENNTEETENNMQQEDKPEKPKQRFIVETITMTTVTERRIVREESDSNADESSIQNATDLKRNGILKGGKLWRNSTEKVQCKNVNYNEMVNFKENNEGEGAHFIETSNIVDDKVQKEIKTKLELAEEQEESKKIDNEAVSPESRELTLTFKLGQHLLVANSLKPNSAMRQLFPSPRFLSPPPLEDNNDVEVTKTLPPKQFLVTAESLKLFEEAKKSKILGNMNSEESNQSFIAIMPPMSKSNDDFQNNRINKTIEKNSLRRSLIKYSYEYRNKRLSDKKKNESTLEERIRQLTCDVDDEAQEEKQNECEDEMPARSSPQGEESKELSNSIICDTKNLRLTESVSNSSNSNLTSSTYKKLTDLFSRKSNPSSAPEDINRNIKSETAQCDLILNAQSATDSYTMNSQIQKNSLGIFKNISRISQASDSKKQYLSSLAPLTACVNADEADKYRIIEGGDRLSENVKLEYSLEDIAEGLREPEKKLGVQPDVIAETPQNETSNDELANFAQQGARRIEKLKKRYSASDDKSDDDDDYGFNKRPVVKGITIQRSANNESQNVSSSQSSSVAGCVTKTNMTTATTSAPQANWPYYSQENIDPKLRNTYLIRHEDGNPYTMHGNTQDYSKYSTPNYVEYQPLGQQKINYTSQTQQNMYSSTNTYYRCQPVRFSGASYSELSNYQFRHPPHSPPPVRRIVATPQPSPIPSEVGSVRNFDNRVLPNKNSGTYSCALGANESCNIPKVGLPEVGLNLTSQPLETGRKTAENTFHRAVPNVHNPCLQMKFSPINYHQGGVPTASIRFSASCSPHSVIDESNVIIEPHYSTLPHPPGQNTVGVIRVGQGQQMIRVPVPYPTGAPVQVHLMAGRLGRCESPQRPSSPQSVVKVPMQPYNQYHIAKGTQTAQTHPKTITQPNPETGKTVDFEKQGKAIAEELQTRQKLALSRSSSQETSFSGKTSQSAPEPTTKMVPQERGVPEGAASTSVQDLQPPKIEKSTAGAAGNTVYYTMNV